ncbi:MULTISPECIES: GNAT family N-acetyltransferase [unclassified Luteococcus]|uniref:GNAT family N-acetyltransferase n=1 Tax=unclassified Luteococcus TaxID=2639923 RepID=UPI00313ADCB4
MGRAGKKSPGAGRGRLEVSVSRIEEHHVLALEDGRSPLAVVARELHRQRAAGEGFALVAVVDALPVGLLGIRFTDDGWLLHGLAVSPQQGHDEIANKLLDAAEELARPLGSLTWRVDPDGGQATLAHTRGYTVRRDLLVKELG